MTNKNTDFAGDGKVRICCGCSGTGRGYQKAGTGLASGEASGTGVSAGAAS